MRGSTLKLVAADVRLVFRDPLLMIMPFTPFLAAGALRFALPILSDLIEQATGFRILAHADLIRVVITLFPGMFFGMVAGFLLLDDRDDGVSLYWGATPVGRAGYLAARLALFSAAAFVAGLVAAAVLGLGTGGLVRDGMVSFIGALQTAVFALFLGAYASNKVEGLALVKVLGGLDLAPLAVFLRLPGRIVAWPFPQYWVAEFALGWNASPPRALSPVSLILALATSVCWLVFLSFRYRKRVD